MRFSPFMIRDHYGISENHNKAMAEVLGKEEITDFDNAQLQRVPLLILNSGAEGGVNHTYSGQIDVRPVLFVRIRSFVALLFSL